METISSLTDSVVHDDASVLASSLVEQVNTEDIASMVYIQQDMLARFEKTNEMLINFNMLSLGRYEATLKNFHRHTVLLSDMKKDLDTVFKRIRLLKQRLEKIYPEAFSACSSVYNIVSEDEEEDSDETMEPNVAKGSYQAPPNVANSSYQAPPNVANSSYQAPPNEANSSYQPSPNGTVKSHHH